MNGWILEKSEYAWANYLSGSLSSSVSVYTGDSVITKEGPDIICVTTDADEIENGSGVYGVNTLISFRYPFNDSGSVDAKNLIESELMNAMFNNASIINDLTGSVNNLHIYDVIYQGHQKGFEGDCYTSNTVVSMIVVHKA